MAIVQISRIQQRRGLQQDLPQLAGGEFGWSVDERRLFIGNGSLIDGAYPGTAGGHTEVLTEYSDILNIAELYTFKGLSAGFTVQTGVDISHPVRRTLRVERCLAAGIHRSSPAPSCVGQRVRC